MNDGLFGPDNPGKYDNLCTLVRKRAKAKAALVIVVDGEKGHGFSAQGDLQTLLGVPDMLEYVARQLRGQTRAVKPG